MKIMCKLAIVFLLTFFTACGVKTNIPVGEIPTTEAPSRDKTARTKSLVEQAFDEEGVQLKQRGKNYKRVQAIINNLTFAVGLPKNTYPVFIADAGEQVNAMAIEDNTIVVYEELLDRVPDDNELATVLGHEMAHIIAKHGADNTAEDRNSMLKVGSLILGAAVTTGAILGGMDPYAADVAAEAAEQATSVIGMGTLVRSYDRKLEYEADHVGLMIMAKAGYNPQRAIDFWERSEEIFGTANGGIAFLSTHPIDKSRARELEDAMPIALQYYCDKTGKLCEEIAKEDEDF